MPRTRKSNAELKRVARWQEIVAAYQRKHRLWVMTRMPEMPPEHWTLYERWVGGFGALCLDQASHNTRKLRRRMKAARKAVTATVALRGHYQEAAKLPPPGSPPFVHHRYQKMRFAMGMTRPIAPGTGAAKRGRATRRT